MLDFFTGFDHMVTADLTTGVTPRFTSVSGTSPTVQTTIKRHGTSALRCNGTSATAIKAGLSNSVTRYLGFAMYVDDVASGSLTTGFAALGDAGFGSLLFAGGGAHVTLVLNSSGTIGVYRGKDLGATGVGTLLGTTTNAIGSDTWYYIEVMATIDNSAGAVSVWVNGVLWLALTGVDTRAGGGAYSNAFGLCGHLGGCYFDDVYCVSSTGGTRTTRLGDVKCVSVAASAGDGAVAQFTPSTGSDNGAMVDEATPDGDTTYNASAAPGNIDTYAFPACGVVGAVLGVNIHNYVKKTDAGTCDAQSVARIGGSNYLGTQTPVSTSYGFLTEMHELSPATVGDFTVGEIDGAEFGVKHAA